MTYKGKYDLCYLTGSDLHRMTPNLIGPWDYSRGFFFFTFLLSPITELGGICYKSQSYYKYIILLSAGKINAPNDPKVHEHFWLSARILYVAYKNPSIIHSLGINTCIWLIKGIMIFDLWRGQIWIEWPQIKQVAKKTLGGSL